MTNNKHKEIMERLMDLKCVNGAMYFGSVEKPCSGRETGECCQNEQTFEETEKELKNLLTSHTNTILQGVVERVEKQQKEWSIISEKADTIFMTGKPTEDYSLEQAHHDAGYYGNKAEALDVAVSLLNDQIISNEEKK